MTDVLEVVINNDPLELVFTDTVFEVAILEDNTQVVVNSDVTEIQITNESVDILTIAEQGPTAAFGVAIGNTPPSNPSVGDLWLNTN